MSNKETFVPMTADQLFGKTYPTDADEAVYATEAPAQVVGGVVTVPVETYTVSGRLDYEIEAMLEALCEHTGMTKMHLIECAINAAYKQATGTITNEDLEMFERKANISLKDKKKAEFAAKLNEQAVRHSWKSNKVLGHNDSYCVMCDGSGMDGKAPCSNCNGNGFIRTMVKK